MKLSAKKISKQSRSILIETELSEYYLNRFMLGIDETKKYEITIKEHKENRSVRQNSMLWAIIEKISLEINGSKRDEDIWKVYVDLLHRANIKYEILAGEEKVLPILQEHFRYVEKLNNSMVTERGKTLYAFKCYIGSSKFDTKEMMEMIQASLDYATLIGISDLELDLIREEYR
jgi:hypothetical protein